ncbi:hypothetical protein Tco_1439020 [Tanacetum coccineum]
MREAWIQLSKDQLAILADTREIINFGLGAFTVTTNALFQANGVEVYDSDCDDIPNTQPSFMANISSYGSDALFEVIQINLDNKSVNDSLTNELERYKEQVKDLKEGQNVNLKSKDNVSDSCEQSIKIDRLKQTLSEHLKEKESLIHTITLLKNDFKKEESRNIDREIALEKKIKQLDNIVFKRDQSAQTVYMLTKPQFFYDHTTKQALGFQNPFYLKKAQQLEPKLYDGNVIKNTSDIVISDSKETLMLAEESHPSPSYRPTKVEVPKELPKVSMDNTSLKKLKHHLAGFDVVVKERTTTTTITEGFVSNLRLSFSTKRISFEKEIYDKLFKSYTTLEKHCISLEVDTQLNQEIFQRDNSVSNQSAPSFDQYFKLNELKAQSQEKDMVIKKLKERIKSLSGNMNEDKVKKDIKEIETINIELDHRVSKLIAKNEHLKQTYKQLYDSIKPIREKGLVITALKNELRKLKGKSVIAYREYVNKPKVITPVVHKVDLEPLSPKLKNNREAHVDYIRITKENADTLRDIVEQA